MVFSLQEEPAAIAERLFAILQDPEYLAQCRERGRRRAALFSWENSARALHQVFENVLRV